MEELTDDLEREFADINLLIHPFLERITHQSPVLMLMCLAVLVSLIPLHPRLEHFIKHKLTERNKAIWPRPKKRLNNLKPKN
jgi:hypothetical protein